MQQHARRREDLGECAGAVAVEEGVDVADARVERREAVEVLQ
jgi:hypothetical protein